MEEELSTDSQAQLVRTAKGQLDQVVAKLVDVSTGGQEIKQVEPEYKKVLGELRGTLAQLHLPMPIPWRSLWDWRGHWRANFASYQERRDYISTLVEPTQIDLDRLEAGQALNDPGSPSASSWSSLDARIQELARELQSSTTLDGWQDCGRRSREILVDMSKLMSQMLAVPDGAEAPKAASGKEWYDLFLDEYASGSSSSDFRKFYRASWDLAQKTTHSDVNGVDAFASAQAVILIVRLTERMLVNGPRSAG